MKTNLLKSIVDDFSIVYLWLLLIGVASCAGTSKDEPSDGDDEMNTPDKDESHEADSGGGESTVDVEADVVDDVACSFITYEPTGSLVVVENSANGVVTAAISAAAYTSPGLDCRVGAEGEVVNLSMYDTLVFDANVASGTTFDVGIGRDQDGTWFGCSWWLQGQGNTSYIVDLTRPNWCAPTHCSYDMKAQFISFHSSYLSSAHSLRMEIGKVQLARRDAAAEVTSTPGSGIGPNKKCWHPESWGTGKGTFIEPVSKNGIKVKTESPNDQSGGAAQMEFPEVDLSAAIGVDVRANVPDGRSFIVNVGDNGSNFCEWYLTGTGETTTYSVRLSEIDNCFGPGTLDLAHIRLFDIQGVPAETLEFEVFDVAVVD